MKICLHWAVKFQVLISLLVFTACANHSSNVLKGDKAQKDYYLITSQLHSYKQEFEQVDRLLSSAKKYFPQDKHIGLYHAHIKASKGDLKGSSDLFSDLLVAHPQDEQVLSSAAEFYFEVGRREVALMLYSNLQKLNPKTSEYWLRAGRILLEFGQIREAAAHFIYVVENLPQSAHKGHYQLGLLYKITGQSKKSLLAFGACLDVKESCLMEWSEMQWAKGKSRKVLNALEKFLIHQPESVRILAALTDYYYALKMLQEAASTLRRIERIDPKNKIVKRRLAQLMIREGNYQGALERYERLVSGLKAEPEDRANLANIYILLKNYEKAFEQLNQVSKKSELYPQLFATKYRLYILNEGVETAHRYIASEHKRNRTNESGLILARSYIQKDNYLKAGKVLDRLLRKSPEAVPVLHLRGMVMHELGQSVNSLPYFEKVIELDPEHASSLNFIAYQLAVTNTDLERAESLARRARNIDASEPHYIDTLGYILYRKKDFQKARVLLEEARQKMPEEPVIAEHLADVYFELGLQNEALKIYLLALPSLKGDNRERVGGKIARIKSNRKLSSVTDDK